MATSNCSLCRALRKRKRRTCRVFECRPVHHLHNRAIAGSPSDHKLQSAPSDTNYRHRVLFPPPPPKINPGTVLRVPVPPNSGQVQIKRYTVADRDVIGSGSNPLSFNTARAILSCSSSSVACGRRIQRGFFDDNDGAVDDSILIALLLVVGG